MGAQRVNVDGVGRLPAFCHAVIAGNHLHVSGMIGTDGDLEFVERGIRIETTRDRKSTRLNSSHTQKSRMPSSA